MTDQTNPQRPSEAHAPGIPRGVAERKAALVEVEGPMGRIKVQPAEAAHLEKQVGWKRCPPVRVPKAKPKVGATPRAAPTEERAPTEG